jgi:leader peptidase (prepilin peptidase) / N-methyltransferase
MTTFPAWFWPVLVAPFIGSFLGVLVTRLPAGSPVVVGRSACDHCAHRLGVVDLVPVVGWVVRRGHCHYCDGKLTALYPSIELAAVFVAAWAAAISGGWLLWVGCTLGWSLLALAIIDWRDGILPDALTLPLMVLGLAAAAAEGAASLQAHAIGALTGFGVFATIAWFYRLWRGRDGLGFGDVKLLMAAGALVSWDGLPSVILIAAVASFALALVARKIALTQRVPFGPGLCIGIWLVWLYGPLG